MKTSILIWIGVALVVIISGWYFLTILPAEPYVAPSTNMGLNGSPSQTNTGQVNIPPVQKTQTNTTRVIAPPNTNNTPAQTNTAQVNIPAILRVATNSALGNHLVASNGMTLYLFTKDTANLSNCYDDCAVKWPPYSPTTSEPVVPGDGVIGKLGLITRAGGGTQLTYNGIPLYYWYLDAKPGDVLGQNVGGVWFVVRP